MNKFGLLLRQDILDIENRLNIQLPDDYKKFLMNTNGGIYYWDDSYHFEASDDENNMYYLANDFEAFFNGL